MKNLVPFKLFESYLPPIKDTEIVAATLIGEAGGEEDKDAMKAVLNVLQNRAKIKETTPARESLRPKQFSMWNEATSGVKVRTDFSQSKINQVINKHRGHKKWNEALKLASTTPKDVTGGATHYYAPKGVKRLPAWEKGWTKTKTIGGHIFGKDVKF